MKTCTQVMSDRFHTTVEAKMKAAESVYQKKTDLRYRKSIVERDFEHMAQDKEINDWTGVTLLKDRD